MSRRICILYHGRCFDGVASAAVLGAHLLRRHPGAELLTAGLEHQPGGSFVPHEALVGDVNAVVDFVYTTDARLHWYFDHHPTGVRSEAERRHLEADQTGRKVLDPSYPSCAGLVRDVLRDRFGFDAPELQELVRWADVIDSAGYRDAEEACSLETAARRWALVVDALGSSEFLAPRIEQLARGVSLEQLMADPALAEAADRLTRQQERGMAALARVCRLEGDVARYELPAEVDGRYPRFGPYLLFPQAHHAVGIVTRRDKVSVTVGRNPWNPPPRPLDIGALCRRYGGGGHAVVGGITFATDDLPRARQVADEVVAHLRLAASQGCDEAPA